MSFNSKLNKAMLINYSATLMVYLERHKIMDLVVRLLAQLSQSNVKNPRKWLGKHVVAIGREIYKNYLDCVHNKMDANFYQMPRRFLYRIVIFGIPGSGRRTQAYHLSKQFNLIYLDATSMIHRYINETNELGKDMQDALTMENIYAKSKAIGDIINQRLLQPDALQHGWVLVNYPNNMCEARFMFEDLVLPPNKFFFLQCPVRMARGRFVSRTFPNGPQENYTYHDQVSKQFTKSEEMLNAYLKTRREIIYIDATPCCEVVKNNIITELMRIPYLTGVDDTTRRI